MGKEDGSIISLEKVIADLDATTNEYFLNIFKSKESYTITISTIGFVFYYEPCFLGFEKVNVYMPRSGFVTYCGILIAKTQRQIHFCIYLAYSPSAFYRQHY